MPGAITRREFLKLSSLGAAAAALAAARASGKLGAATTWPPARVATWLPAPGQGFPAYVWTAAGQLIAVEANEAHPLAHWFDRAAAETFTAASPDLHALAGPAKAAGGLSGERRDGLALQPLRWRAATAALADILRSYPTSQIAFVVGDFPDHLHDLVQRLAFALGGATVLRFSPLALSDKRLALQDAAWQVYGQARVPFFKLAQAEWVYAFGVRGNEPWLADVFDGSAGGNAATQWAFFDPEPPPGGRGEWVQIRPGSHARAAQALAHGVMRLRAGAADESLVDELAGAAETCGLSLRRLTDLCGRFAGAFNALAIPGAGLLPGPAGVAAARTILAFNLAAGGAGQVFLPVDSPLHADLDPRPASHDELSALVERIRLGQIKVLLVHGANLGRDLQAVLAPEIDVFAALDRLDHLVSFNPTVDETGALAGLLLPGLLPLETAGYQRAIIGADRPLVSALQPAMAAGPGRRSAGDTLLAAARLAGVSLPYHDEADFIVKSLRRLRWPHGADMRGRWQVQGGWWTDAPARFPAVCVLPPAALRTFISG